MQTIHPRSIEEMLERLKQLVSTENIKTQPESALKELLDFEKTYKMSTNQAMQLRDSIGEEIHLNDDYNYLTNWHVTYETYQLFDGDESLINTF